MFIKENENISNVKETNICYYPEIIEFMLTYYLPLLPLWSGVILNPAINLSTDSNASVENWFRIVKHSIYNSETGMRAADFIRSIYINIDDRIAAFKFAFTSLANKVFKPKKRKIQIENEENSKEEWSKRKKSKISYIHPSTSKIGSVFNSIKSNKQSNAIVEYPTNIVNCDLKSDSIDNCKLEDKLSCQNSINSVKEVEIITDIDIVELASIDYKLPAFQPLTYKGQRDICERLKLKLSNCIDCSRHDIPRNSNLREYVPSKMLPVPGDGNCLFSALSFWVTGSIDNFHKIRSIIIDNMVGNLKRRAIKLLQINFHVQ